MRPVSQVTLTSADSSCRGIPQTPRVDFALVFKPIFMLCCFGPCVSHSELITARLLKSNVETVCGEEVGEVNYRKVTERQLC